ncbi:hypothetical protein [Myxococcus eversor]|uniref:hypothetical protein n=1 Tax=Myxococcus eversor TaxID=2709661 RepID=UPI0013D02DBE|nr:hypothetical protein [Myxococcus eversor]
MRYGEDKAFEMARSLLPSTSRREARKNRVNVSRRARRTSSTRIAQLIRAPELSEDCAELDDDSSSDMRGVVFWRRQADKVNPFIRWAKRRTLKQPRDLRLGLVRGALPPGLIGHHALSHLKGVEHFLSTVELSRRDFRRGPQKSQPIHDRGVLAQLLRELLRLPTGQKSFNGYLKHATASGWSVKWGRDGQRHVVLHGCNAPRLLLGVHDVLSFLDDLGFDSRPETSRKSDSRTGASTQLPTLFFLQVFHRLGGDLTATLAAIPKPKLTHLPCGRVHRWPPENSRGERGHLGTRCRP